jgi:c-di-AMP phosphodiesterase-like protein
MNKTLRRLVEPGRLPYALLLLFAAAAVNYGQYTLAAGTGGAIILLLIVNLILRSRREKRLAAYIESRVYETESAKSSTLINFPLPIAIFKLEDSRIIWGNEAFFKMCGESGTRLDANIAELIPQFTGGWLLEGKDRYPTLIEVNGRKYQLHGTLIRSEQETENSVFMGITYWVDVTDYDDIRIEYENTRPVAGIIIIDNLDELMKNQPDRVKNDLRDAVEDKLGRWCADFSGILRRYDRDRYLLIMERQHLERLKEGKFSITDEIHDVVSPSGINATISIGLGAEAESFADAMQAAETAVELALSRGGDQTVIKNRTGFTFFGGRGSEVEKRTKVRSRVTANSFSNLVQESSGLLIMGHRNGDMDSYGAAVGIYSIARQRGLKASIVADVRQSAAKSLIETLRREAEYRDAFLDPADLPAKIEPDTLLVVVDTSRPEQVEVPALLNQCERVVVIDHHRVGATYIQNAALNYVEPYASSACELVTEILQEMPDMSHILRCEAEALLAGIVLDTKSFTLRTGERTFDAASWLRSEGADTSAVKRLFQLDLAHTVARYRILQQAEIYRGIAIAAPSEPQERVVAAQAADELLNISGVDASVVIVPNAQGGCFVSARSIGEVNVQLIMEKLGGGGNRSAAAAQFAGESADQVLEKVRAAIDDYLS